MVARYHGNFDGIANANASNHSLCRESYFSQDTEKYKLASVCTILAFLTQAQMQI